MTQTSGPLVGQNFTDALWRNIFGGESGIVGDTQGTAYKLTIPTSSDMLGVGTTSGASEDSRSVVAGFGHQIPAGSPEEIEIPTVSGGGTIGRTDRIVVRYNPAWTDAPGPCRLYRIAGTVGSADAPAYDDGPPGVEDMPLWRITRKSGQSLTQVAAAGQIVDDRRWIGPSMFTVANPMGTGVPLGTTFLRGNTLQTFRLDGNGAPEWYGANLALLTSMPWANIQDPETITSVGTFGSSLGQWTSTDMNSVLSRRGSQVTLDLTLRLSSSAWIPIDANGIVTEDFSVFQLSGNRYIPRREMELSVRYRNNTSGWLGGHACITSGGLIRLDSLTPQRRLDGHATAACLRIHAVYEAKA